MFQWTNMDVFEDVFDILDGRASHAKPYSFDAKGNLTIALPGFRRTDVSVDITGNVMRVYAQRDTSKYEQAFIVPTTVDKTAVTAHMEDGMLTITLPPTAESKSRKIEIA